MSDTNQGTPWASGTSWQDAAAALNLPVTASLLLTAPEVASLRDVLAYAQRVVGGTYDTPARFSDLELSELALRTAVLARALERAAAGE